MTKYAFMSNFFGEFHNQWSSSVVLINMKQSHFRQFFLLCLLLLRAVLVLFLSSVQPSQKDLGSGPNGSGSSAPDRKTIFSMSNASLGTSDAMKTEDFSERSTKTQRTESHCVNLKNGFNRKVPGMLTIAFKKSWCMIFKNERRPKAV